MRTARPASDVGLVNRYLYPTLWVFDNILRIIAPRSARNPWLIASAGPIIATIFAVTTIPITPTPAPTTRFLIGSVVCFKCGDMCAKQIAGVEGRE